MLNVKINNNTITLVIKSRPAQRAIQDLAYLRYELI
jgi:type II secretory pathway component HofQ